MQLERLSVDEDGREVVYQEFEVIAMGQDIIESLELDNGKYKVWTCIVDDIGNRDIRIWPRMAHVTLTITCRSTGSRINVVFVGDWNEVTSWVNVIIPKIKGWNSPKLDKIGMRKVESPDIGSNVNHTKVEEDEDKSVVDVWRIR